jgi:hypothetical protein
VLAIAHQDVASMHLLVDERLRQPVRLDRPDEVANEIEVDRQVFRKLRHARQAPVGHAQGEYVIPALDELQLQPGVTHEQRLELLEGRLALEDAPQCLA